MSDTVVAFANTPDVLRTAPGRCWHAEGYSCPSLACSAVSLLKTEKQAHKRNSQTCSGNINGKDSSREQAIKQARHLSTEDQRVNAKHRMLSRHEIEIKPPKQFASTHVVRDASAQARGGEP